MTTQNMTNTNFPLPKSLGGTGLTVYKPVLQIVSSVIPLTNINSVIPFDNTIPQSTEGVQLATVSITQIDPAINCRFNIYAEINTFNPGVAQAMTMALFRIDTDAVAASLSVAPAGGERQFMNLFHVVVPRVGANVFKLRFGTNNVGV
jgi:hypothetical protein